MACKPTCDIAAAKFKINADNHLQFHYGFPEVVSHFGLTQLIYGNPSLARQLLTKENQEQVYEWDRLNHLALGKLKYYLHESIYNIVQKGDNLTASKFYQLLFNMFLQGNMHSRHAHKKALSHSSDGGETGFYFLWSSNSG